MKMIFKKSMLCLNVTAALMLLAPQAHASDFSIPFSNVAGLGDFYAGWAASASDASTAYLNPAGLTQLKHPQVVVSAIGLQGSSKFTGTTSTPASAPEVGSASTRLPAFIPSLYLSAPVNNKVVFGMHATAPFGLGTNYAKDSIVRYAGTKSAILVLDFGPDVGVQINDKFSVGLGFDAQRLSITLNSMTSPALGFPGAENQNSLSGWGYGWHGGLLYQATPSTRVGLSYNSMVNFHTSGSSTVYTNSIGDFRSRLSNNTNLPARTQLSVTQDFGPRWTALATAFYTNWHTFDKATLRNYMLPFGTTTTVVIPFNYHNTFDYSLGVNYKATDQLLLRTGVQFWHTPSNNQNRSTVDPMGNATFVGVGAHYQQNKAIGYDIAYAHCFFDNTPINLTTPLYSVNGHSKSQNNAVGVQLNYNFI